jgi:hypothetical protein
VIEPSGTGGGRILYPQVLHIGFSKCASTYLRAIFRGHPDVHLVFKSGHFTPFLANRMDFAEYQRLFRAEPGVVNVESDEHLTLPGIHPTLGVRATNLDEFAAVADGIRAELPDVRLIMVVRNQCSLVVSRYSEYLITGGALGFEEFADELLGTKSGANLWFQNYYRRIIAILEQRFPADRLLVLLQESMRENTAATVSRILQFMGLDDKAQTRDGLRSERRSLSYRGMQILAGLNRLMVNRPSYGGGPPDTRVPLAVFRNVVRAVRAADYYALSRVSSGPSVLMTEARARQILDHFREDNLALQDYFRRDLYKLGYLQQPL